jgi:hypothetical protein
MNPALRSMASHAALRHSATQRQTTVSRTGAAVGVAVLAGIVGIGVPALGAAVFGNSAAGIWSGVLLVMAAGAPTAMRLRRHPLDAPGLYAAFTMSFLGVTSLAWLGDPIGPGPGLSQADVAEALRLVAVGLVCFGLGAWLAAPGTSTERPERSLAPSTVPSSAALLVMFAASVVGTTISFALGTYGYISDPAAVSRASSFIEILGLAAPIGHFVVIATAVSYFATGERRLMVLLIVFVTTQMIVGYVAGFKGAFLLPLVFVVGAYVLARRRWPVVPIAVTLVCIFVIVVPTNERYREAVRTESMTPEAALSEAVTVGLDFSPSTVLSSTVDYVATRFRSIDSVALILDQTPSPFPYADGDNYALLPAIAVVPRAVWRGKPTFDQASQFTHTYRQVSMDVRSSTPLTQVGDLYRNFGYLGVVVGLFCVGLLAGGGMRAFRRFQSPRAQFMYVYVVMTIVISVESDLPALLATASKTVPFAALAAWLLLPGRYTGLGYHRLLRRT